MKRIGITGQNGFVGTHLYNSLGLYPDKYQRVDFERHYLDAPDLLDHFVKQCDVIVHLAGMNRHEDQQVIYKTNLELANKLANALSRTGSKAHIVFSSSSQEERDNLYGKSKKEARSVLHSWAIQHGGVFTGMIIPNVFGPFGKPYYNSVIATFCHQLNNNEEPVINVDAELKLIYVGELVQRILESIDEQKQSPEFQVPPTSVVKVSDILTLLKSYKDKYLEKGCIPSFQSAFELNLFNTFRCYMQLRERFPAPYKQHIDNRGAFTELIRLEIGGQVSFSTTKSGITRGNHFHTRKIERFSVIKGKALIQLRKIGTNDVLNFELDGESPAYVDMPIWHTHNIKNIGTEDLYTVFWINEPYDPMDPDTFFENV